MTREADDDERGAARRAERTGGPNDGGAPAIGRALAQIEHRVRFQDVDAAGMLPAARLLELFHDAYVAWLAGGGVTLEAVLGEGKYGLPLAHAALEQRAAARHGDQLTIAVVGVTARERSLRVTYSARRALAEDQAGGELARGESVHVAVDLASQRPCALPDEITRAVAATAQRGLG